MPLDTSLKMRYSAPLSGFNCRNNWEAYQDRAKDPWAYLDSYGMEPIVEMLYRGFSPSKIAREYNINQRILMAWIEGDPERHAIYEQTFQYVADDQMYEARDILDNCGLTSEEIRKAANQADHRRHMAKGFGSRRWGAKVDINQNTTATLSYQFNIALSPEQQARVIEGTASKLVQEQPKMIDVNELIGPGFQSVDLSIGNKDELSYEEARACEEAEQVRAIEESQAKEENDK